MSAVDRFSASAAELRTAFDDSFAVAAPPPPLRDEAVLAIRVGVFAYGIRASAVAGLTVDFALAPIPSPVRELLGVASIRGSIVAIYDLGLLLGHGPGANPRWIVLAPGPKPIGLAFDAFDGQVPVPADAVIAGADHAPGDLVHGAILIGDAMRPLISIPAVLSVVLGLVRPASPMKEQ